MTGKDRKHLWKGLTTVARSSTPGCPSTKPGQGVPRGPEGELQENSSKATPS